MNTMRFRLFLFLIPLALIATPASAIFDPLEVSPRARAMGGVVAAVPGDAWSVYHNPSLLSWIPNPEVAGATARPNNGDYNRLTAISGSIVLPDEWGGMSFGLRSYGVEYKDVDLLSEYTLSVSHGFQLFRDESSAAAFGWSLNFYNLDLAQSVGRSGDGSDGINPGNAWTVGLDLSAVVEIWDRTKAGFMVRNLNSPTIGLDNEELWKQVVVGISYSPYDNVITAMDIRSQPGEDFRFHGGFEFGVLEILNLRAGLETNPNKVTAGFGFLVKGIMLDYAFSTGGGVLESTHQVGLGYRFATGGE